MSSLKPLSAGAQSNQHCRQRQGCWVRGWGGPASEPSGGRSYAPDILGSGAPTFRADFHTNPPVESFKHFEGAHNTNVTGGIGVACVHDPRSGQEGHIDANRVIKRRPSNAGRRAIWARGNCDVVADKQNSIVIILDQAAFGSEIKYIRGVGTLVRGNVVAERGQRVWGTAELDVSAGCITEGVFTSCLFRVTMAVVQQSVREVGTCSLDLRVWCCRMEGRCRLRKVRLKVGRGRRRASRGKTTCRGRGA